MIITLSSYSKNELLCEEDSDQFIVEILTGRSKIEDIEKNISEILLHPPENEPL